jgi:hypothetical protein
VRQHSACLFARNLHTTKAHQFRVGYVLIIASRRQVNSYYYHNGIFLLVYPIRNPDLVQTRDSTANYLHMHHSHHADLLESFTNPTSSQLAPEDIYIPPHLQPVNPEDEDDVVPDQHAAFGIQRATQTKKEPTWRDLGLEELMRRGPGGGVGSGASARASGGAGVSAGGVAVAAHEEPVMLALRRQPGASGSGVRVNGGETHSVGGGAGNGLPR